MPFRVRNSRGNPSLCGGVERDNFQELKRVVAVSEERDPGAFPNAGPIFPEPSSFL